MVALVTKFEGSSCTHAEINMSKGLVNLTFTYQSILTGSMSG
jgi:hypothetical protein